MPHLEGVAIPHPFGGVQQRTAAHAPVVMACEALGRRRIGGQQLQESFDAIGPEGIAGRELPEEGPGLAAEREHAAGEEVGERRARAGELEVVSDEAASLHREHEAIVPFSSIELNARLA